MGENVITWLNCRSMICQTNGWSLSQCQPCGEKIIVQSKASYIWAPQPPATHADAYRPSIGTPLGLQLALPETTMNQIDETEVRCTSLAVEEQVKGKAGETRGVLALNYTWASFQPGAQHTSAGTGLERGVVLATWWPLLYVVLRSVWKCRIPNAVWSNLKACLRCPSFF